MLTSSTAEYDKAHFVVPEELVLGRLQDDRPFTVEELLQVSRMLEEKCRKMLQ